MPELPSSMQPHFQHLYAPCDGSRPDPAYRGPPPPPPDRGPDAPDDEEPGASATEQGEPGGKRDGMQQVGQAESSKPPPNEEKSDDYKRQGKSNGLQRNHKEHDLLSGFLPPIAVVPCTTPACDCKLKK